jgi:hypothetical protein
MEFKTFTIADLRLALLSDEFWRAKTLPISRQKALSFCHNPRAEKDDPALLVAYVEDEAVGYLGMLPDRIFLNDTGHKMGWLTGWWVSSMAPRGVGAILLYKALNAYRERVGVAGGSREARKALLASQKFIALNPLSGFDIRFRFNTAARIPRRFPPMKIFRIGFRVADVVLDEIVNLRGFFWERSSAVRRRLTFEYVSSIDEEAGRFIERHHRQDLARKAKADLNWIMAYPWIVSAPQKDSAGRRYFFSSISARFLYLGVKVFEQTDGLIGFLMLSVRDDRMSVLFSHFEDGHASAIAAAAVYHALAMDVSTLSLYDERLVKGFSGLRCPCWSMQPVSRGFFLSQAFADMPLADCRLQGGDGDFAFY